MGAELAVCVVRVAEEGGPAEPFEPRRGGGAEETPAHGTRVQSGGGVVEDGRNWAGAGVGLHSGLGSGSGIGSELDPRPPPQQRLAA
eukprot:scaffold67875_cov48-Phaeocystis_antarctica.AAC.2